MNFVCRIFCSMTIVSFCCGSIFVNGKWELGFTFYMVKDNPSISCLFLIYACHEYGKLIIAARKVLPFP